MKVKMIPAPGAEMVIVMKDGKKIAGDAMQCIEVTPFFSLVNGPGEVVTGESLTNNGDQVDKFTLTASGANGKVKRANRVEKSVIPLIDKPKVVKPAIPAHKS